MNDPLPIQMDFLLNALYFAVKLLLLLLRVGNVQIEALAVICCHEVAASRVMVVVVLEV